MPKCMLEMMGTKNSLKDKRVIILKASNSFKYV